MSRKGTKSLQENSNKLKRKLPFYKTPYSRLPSHTKRLRAIDEELLQVSVASLTRTHYMYTDSNLSISDYSDLINNLYSEISGVSRWDLYSKFLLDSVLYKSCVCYVSVRNDKNISESVIETASYLSNMLRFYYKTVVNKSRVHTKPLEETCIYLAKHLHRMVTNNRLSLTYYRWKGVYTKAISDDKQVTDNFINPNFNYLMDLIDMLHYNKMGVTFLGFKFKDGSSENSLFLPTGELLEHLISVCKGQPKVKEDLSKKNTIIIRDADKNIVSVEEFIDIEEFIEVNEKILEELNTKLQSHTFEIEGVEIDGISFSRIFSDSSVDCGGRLYDRGEWTTLPKHIRKLLKINGEGILTADLKAIHPCLLYREEGVLLSEDFDPYPVLDIKFDQRDCNKYKKYYGIKDYNPIRSVAKVALLIMLNSSSRSEAKNALRYKLLKDYQKAGTSREDSMSFVGVSVSDLDSILDQVETHNSAIAKHFYTSVSKRLMRIDSDIIVEVAKLLLAEGVIMLPLHDSISVPESKIDLAIKLFRQAYVNVVGDNVNFKVELE